MINKNDMKKMAFALILFACLTSCDNNDNKGLFDPRTPIVLSGAQTRSTDDSVFSIVKNSMYLQWRDTMDIGWTASFGTGESYLYENGLTRDFANKRILFAGIYVIFTVPDTDYHRPGDFLNNAKDVVFSQLLDSTGAVIDPQTLVWEELYKVRRDTIAYIPNRILKSAQDAINTAYYADDFTTCYKLFEESMFFVPITGQRWRELKAAGVE